METEPDQKLTLGPTATRGVDRDGGNGNGRDDGVRMAMARLPRWTRQEILVLIQGKRVAEGRGRRGRGGAGSTVEPKWSLVSSYCRRNGVNRGPLQCRKRWSNLAADFKRIKEWEAKVSSEAATDSPSFWAMRNDMRRERRLPGIFDREVYDILDRSTEVPATALALALVPAPEEAEEEAEEVIFDSGRSAAADDGLFSDFEQEDGGGGNNSSSSPRKASEPEEELPTPFPLRISSRSRGVPSEKHTIPDPEASTPSGDGKKRKRPMPEGGAGDDGETAAPDMDLEGRLIGVLERCGKSLTEQLEARDRNRRLDRDQRRDQADGLLAVFGKLADALAKIADKL